MCLVGFLGLACRESTHANPLEPSRECVRRPIRMAIASSLRALFLPLRQHLLENNPAIHVEPIFGASSTLARQLSFGAPIDVFISADAEIVDDLIRRGFLAQDSELEFAHGDLVLIGGPNWLIRDSAISALKSQQLERLAIPSESVPLGRYARAWLDSHQLLDELSGKIVVTEHARATLASVDAGFVDLAIVYRSDSRLARTATVVAQIDSREHPPIRYVAARSINDANCPAIDEALAAWTEPLLQGELASAGFRLAEQASEVK